MYTATLSNLETNCTLNDRKLKFFMRFHKRPKIQMKLQTTMQL